MVGSSGFGKSVRLLPSEGDSGASVLALFKGGSIFAIPSLLNAVESATGAAKELAASLSELAKKYAVTPAAIMLACSCYVIQPGIIPIIGLFTNPKHIVEELSGNQSSFRASRMAPAI